MKRITDNEIKTPQTATQEFFNSFTPQQVAKVLDDCFNSYLAERYIDEDNKFAHWLMIELKELIEAIEPGETKRNRLQKELESIQQP